MKKILIIISLFLVIGCANQTSPTGGPTDKTPPELLTSSPRNNEKNFKGASIQLLFNEDIKLKNPKEEILITPTLGKKTKFIAKGKKLVIEPELPWQENTTYSISLREGVQDITEGNPTNNIQFAFSTGPILDSLQISGTVTQAFSEKILDRVTVAVYQSDTFNIFKHSPTYFTFTDKEGKYTIQNLKSGNYFVYAFEDKNKNLQVESKGEKFAFLKNSFNSNDSIPADLALVKVDARAPKFTTVRHSGKVSSVRFNKEIDSLFLQNTSSVLYRFGASRSELLIHHDLSEGDSIPISLGGIDSTHQRIDTTLYIKSTSQKLIDEQFKITMIESKQDYASKKYRGLFLTNKLIGQINIDSIYIRLDTIKDIRLSKENIRYDTLLNKISIVANLTDSIPQKSKLAIQFGKGAFINFDQDSSKRMSSAIKYIKPDETGTLLIEVSTKEKFYILQLLKSEKVELETRSTQKTIAFRYLEPANYQIRVIIDSNNNGRWDVGSFNDRIEPEKVIYYKNSEGKSMIPTRANWEVGPLMIKF